MGSPLGPTFTNISLSYHEQIWLKNFPFEFKPFIYKRYVDDTFLLFRFWCYVNWQHSNVEFSAEIEENNSVLFLNIKIRRVNNSFSTSIYHKVTFSEFFTGLSPRKFLCWWLCKSWTSYPGQYLDLSWKLVG